MDFLLRHPHLGLGVILVFSIPTGIATAWLNGDYFSLLFSSGIVVLISGLHIFLRHEQARMEPHNDALRRATENLDAVLAGFANGQGGIDQQVMDRHQVNMDAAFQRMDETFERMDEIFARVGRQTQNINFIINDGDDEDAAHNQIDDE